MEARRFTFEEFLLADSPGLVPVIDNGMTRHFCGNVERVGDAELKLACDKLRKMSAILLVERLSDDLRVFFARLGCYHRFALRHDNVTASNFTENPVEYLPVTKPDLAGLSERGWDALRKATAFDYHLHNFAMGLGAELNNQPIEVRADIPLKRGSIARGERLVPARTLEFIEFLGEGWADPDVFQWTASNRAEIVFRVRGTSSLPIKAKVTFSACLVPNRSYVVTDVSVDDEPPQRVLFVNEGTSIQLKHLSGRNIDMICAPQTSAQIEFDLDMTEELHVVRFCPSDVSSPAVLAAGVDRRPLAIRFESLQLT